MVKVILIIVIMAILMEDGSSIKKTAEEEREDAEIAAAVNRTLAEEEKKRKEDEEEKKKRDHQEKEKKPDQGKIKKEKKEDKLEKQDRQDEACLPVNVSCPVVDACAPCDECPPQKECGSCPPVECGPCDPCPEVKECGPCNLLTNHTETTPISCQCPEVSGMSTPMAVVVGATVSLVLVGLVGAVGLLVRYAPPFLSGFVIVATIIITWYLSSHYPATARELGGRVVEVLREATTTLSHRIVAAIRHHNDQVGFSVKPNLFFGMSSMFQKVCTKIFYVEEN
jgi:hypothetical protein